MPPCLFHKQRTSLDCDASWNYYIYEKRILNVTDITKLSVSLHRIQFRAGRGLAVTDWRIFVILPGRPHGCLPPKDPQTADATARHQTHPSSDLTADLEQLLHFSLQQITCGNFITGYWFFPPYIIQSKRFTTFKR